MQLSTTKTKSPPRILLLGVPGSRKTTLALQFPKVHIYDCDNNLDGATEAITKGIIDRGEKDPKKQLIVPPVNPSLIYTFDNVRKGSDGKILDIAECFDRVVDLLKLAVTDKDYQNRDTHVVDSLSHINEFVIRKVLKMRGNKTHMEGLYWTDFASYAYTLIAARLSDINNTGKTVLCTCHEERIYESDSSNIMKKNLTEVNPLFNGKVGDSLGAFFTDVWRINRVKSVVTKDNPSGVDHILETQKSVKCDHLKNSLGMPAEININKGYETIRPYLETK